MTGKVRVLEIVDDPALRKKQRMATGVFRRFFPKAPPLKLYRTRDGRMGFQTEISLAAGERGLFESAYSAVMRALGERRGRPRGERTVQAKLRLHEPVYKALKRAAQRSQTTLSGVVEDLAHRARLV